MDCNHSIPPSMDSHLAQATDDIKLGRVQDADSSFCDIVDFLENMKD